MKQRKILTSLCMTFLVPLLTSCKVNWFNDQYDVPWYYVAVPVAIVFVLAHFSIMSGTYICPKCGTEIRLKWYQIYAYVHMNGGRLVICPNCGRKGFCKRK